MTYRFRKPEELSIDASDPFRADRLGRKSFADNLRVLISSLSQPVVIALNAGWGMGKSTFLRMWVPLLRNDGHVVVTFSAWENDYGSDPLTAIMSAVQEQVVGDAGAAHSPLWDATKRLASRVTNALAPLGVRILTYGLLTAEDLRHITEGVDDSLREGVADEAASLMQKTVDSHVAANRTISAFRSALQTFAGSIIQRVDGHSRSLIVVIDELDRCRPTYAVETLERIKHLFNVPNVSFVLAVDLEQLGHSVGSLYGAGFDADGYLRRFIDLTCSLPYMPTYDFCKMLHSQYGLAEIDADAEFVVRIFSRVGTAFRTSLRQQEQLFAELGVAARLLQGRATGAVELVAVLLFLRLKMPALYTSYLDGSEGAAAVVKYLRSAPDLSAALDDWPLTEAILVAYSRKPDELRTTRAQWLREAEDANAEVQRRAKNRLKFLHDCGVEGYALEKVIRPVLEFTATVRVMPVTTSQQESGT